jgi:hypothetical protein
MARLALDGRRRLSKSRMSKPESDLGTGRVEAVLAGATGQ